MPRVFIIPRSEPEYNKPHGSKKDRQRIPRDQQKREQKPPSFEPHQSAFRSTLLEYFHERLQSSQPTWQRIRLASLSNNPRTTNMSKRWANDEQTMSTWKKVHYTPTELLRTALITSSPIPAWASKNAVCSSSEVARRFQRVVIACEWEERSKDVDEFINAIAERECSINMRKWVKHEDCNNIPFQ